MPPRPGPFARPADDRPGAAVGCRRAAVAGAARVCEDRRVRRRTLLGGIGSAIVLVPMAGCRAWLKKDKRPEVATPHQRATLEAMAETFLPSSDGSPGAREADAIGVILDPASPMLGYLSEVVSDVDDWCHFAHGGRDFVDLAPDERERALEERLGMHGTMIRSWYHAVYEGVLVMSKLAFFGGLHRTVGLTFCGFPARSTGYATASGSGVHAAAGAALEVAGAGQVTDARVTALVAGLDVDRPRMRLTAPDGKVHDVVGPGGLPGALTVDDQPVAGAVGGVAAGTWRLDGPAGAVVTAWWLTLRTELDDRGA